MAGYITATGIDQNNLKHIDVRIPLNRITVVTGVSGSGKSSLAFDTIYAEGQRRYVETFSAYTRQFLDRMDKPKVKSVDGIPPAVAIDQTNPVRTSRSTVGTMTELNDHIKLLFPRIALLSCVSCGRVVKRDSPEDVYREARERFGSAELRGVVLTFPVRIPPGMDRTEAIGLLGQSGYHRILSVRDELIEVVQDRVTLDENRKSRIIEGIEAAYHTGNGSITLYPVYRDHTQPDTDAGIRFSEHLHCPDCDIEYRDPVPNSFSFNSPIGACPRCKGFGRVIEFDPDLVIPDDSKSLEAGAVKPWQTKAYRECRNDMLNAAESGNVRTDIPWSELTSRERQWVLEGDGDGWYGVTGFFSWLESRSYRMHIRVLLSKYRSYNECPECHGRRLSDESLLWRIDGRNMHDIVSMPIDDIDRFFREVTGSIHGEDPASVLILDEIASRLSYLRDVGLGYLTLDRQSRTLSGGEVQRINLTTALGTSLTNTLFVLDEPSIGLHARDVGRLIGVLQRLRDGGNTLLIVEHDPDIMKAADHIIDMGPGPGAAGGNVVFSGSYRRLLASKRSSTGRYLSAGHTGARRVSGYRRDKPGSIADNSLSVRGAREHNLKGIDVDIPVGRFTTMTGVSGSGKSTFLETVLFRAAARHFGRPAETPGECDRIEGLSLFDDVLLVDQSPIGKTSRSNPASYVGAFTPIRELFSKTPEAARRGYTPGTFSFNSGNGRCSTCGGTGFEHVEMQFLSDVYLRCPDCDGTRYRSEILEVRLYKPGNPRGETPSIADVLEMTVDEACAYFTGSASIAKGLKPLVDVGLGYLRLGQPVTTLSGGETQRLKLAGRLAEFASRKRTDSTLFLFDEPTRGLHLEDTELLVGVLSGLVSAGHTVVVIEHNLDFIASSDWVIDLGPEGGELGGSVVFAGPVPELVENGTGHTAEALRTYDRTLVLETAPSYASTDAGARGTNRASKNEIVIRNAREHNLKGIDLSIPRDRLCVITGVSGSGKSTVAFDILFAEGQRRYLESLNAYARQFVQPAGRADVDSVQGIPPTVAIEQRTSRGGWKSTVGTVTEIHDFLRLLYVKLGVRYCPDCTVPIEPRSVDRIVAAVFEDFAAGSDEAPRRIEIFAPMVVARKGYYTELAQWASRRGIAYLRVDGEPVPTEPWPRLDRYREHSIEAPVGEFAVIPESRENIRESVLRATNLGSGAVLVVEESGRSTLHSTRHTCPRCGTGFPELDPRHFSYNSPLGWCPTCNGTGHIDTDEETEEEHETCPDCNGTRLCGASREVRFQNHRITELAAMPVTWLGKTVAAFELDSREEQIARDIVAEIETRIRFLDRVGLGYLSLDRSAPTLSGGEAQRIRLAAQLGSNLRGVCYILDEPTIGLHPRDTERLLDTLEGLKRKGNSVVVVEHDIDTILRADHVIDLGPGAGRSGGRVVATGTPRSLMRTRESITGRYLREGIRFPESTAGPVDSGPALRISGANLRNLKRIDVAIPLERFVCVTGVSGSGKSTLVRDVILSSLSGEHALTRRKINPAGCDSITGYETLDRIREVDQTPIGKTPRSCVATYVGVWDHIRNLFAELPDSKMRGFSASRFSFNTQDGRCPECKGQGYERVEMSFLPGVHVPCEACGGRRFDDETLSVGFRGKNVFEILEMEIDEAAEFFSFHPRIRPVLETLRDVGLGYLALGQQSPTLSGGEAQRIKLVSELAKTAGPNLRGGSNRTLYLLDEPTIGLAMADVANLIRVLHRFVDSGHSLLVIEHNLDVVASADWIIDLGPEGGDEGGAIIAEGTPGMLEAMKDISYTGEYLSRRSVRANPPLRES